MKYIHLFAVMAFLSVATHSLVSAESSGDMFAQKDDMEMPDFESEEFQQMIQQLQSQFKKMEEQMSPEKRARLQAMQETTQKLYDKMDKQQEQIRADQQEKADLKAEVKELKKDVAELEEKIEELQKKVTSLLSQKQKLANALEEASDVIAAGDGGEQPPAMTDDEKEEARKKIKDIDQQITATQLELNEVQGEYSSISTELTEKRDIKRGVKAKIKTEEAAFAEVEKELEDEQKQGEDIFDEMDFSSTFEGFGEEDDDQDELKPLNSQGAQNDYANDSSTKSKNADVDQFAMQQF